MKKAPVRHKNLEDFQGSYLPLPEKVTWQNLRQMTTQIYANLTEKKEKKQRRNTNKKHGTVDGRGGGIVEDREPMRTKAKARPNLKLAPRSEAKEQDATQVNNQASPPQSTFI